MPQGPKIPHVPIRDLVSGWLGAKNVVRMMTEEERKLNKQLSGVVESSGYTDDRGHIWLELDDSVEGFDTKGRPVKYNAVQRQRRVSVIMDEEAALDICEQRGLVSECTQVWLQVTDTARAIEALAEAGLMDDGVDSGIEVITSVREDAIRAAYFEGKITDAEKDQIFTEKITYALLPAQL